MEENATTTDAPTDVYLVSMAPDDLQIGGKITVLKWRKGTNKVDNLGTLTVEEVGETLVLRFPNHHNFGGATLVYSRTKLMEAINTGLVIVAPATYREWRTQQEARAAGTKS